MLSSFLDEGCRGICTEIDGKLAGYAWVQYEGEYNFGRLGRIIIPSGHVIFRNLFVFPEYRGNKLGPKLNAARLALIPAKHVPVVFIIPENRYAIRNWEKYGFERMLEITKSHWIGGRWRMQLKRLSDSLEANVLLKVLEETNYA